MVHGQCLYSWTAPQDLKETSEFVSAISSQSGPVRNTEPISFYLQK